MYCNQWTETRPVWDSLCSNSEPCRSDAEAGQCEGRRESLLEKKLLLRMFSVLAKTIFLISRKKPLRGDLCIPWDAALLLIWYGRHYIKCDLLIFLSLRQQEQLWLQKSQRLRGWRLSLRNCYGFPKMCSHMLRVLSLQYSSIKGTGKSDHGGQVGGIFSQGLSGA